MKLFKNLYLAVLLPSLGGQAFAVETADLNSVSLKQAGAISVPTPGVPVPVDPVSGALNDLTDEPAAGSGRDVGTDPDPYQLVKPEPGYVSPRMQEFESKGIADAGVPKDMLDRALRYFDANKGNIKNQRFLGIVDFAMHSSKARFFVINMEENTVKAFHVAHGRGSDPSQTGYLKSFSNEPGSHQTSRGFYKVGEPFQGSEVGYSAFLDGLTPGHNSNARAREVVMHGADYVSEKNNYAGLSWGCLAVDKLLIATFIDQFRGGAIIYADKSGDLFRE